MSRYKTQTLEDKPTKWEVYYKNEDGTDMIWKYDLSKSDRGPYEVEVIYPKSFKTQHEIMEEQNNKIPLTQRKYINPANGKFVGYQRAKALNLI